MCKFIVRGSRVSLFVSFIHLVTDICFPVVRPIQGVDLLAGVEAVISHLVVKEFQIPCAHAPAMAPIPLSLSLSPKSAAEEVSKL